MIIITKILDEKSHKETLLKELRKITVNKPEKGYAEDLEAVNKWITEVVKQNDDVYIKKYLYVAKKLINNKEMILPFFYYQVEFIFDGGKF